MIKVHNGEMRSHFLLFLRKSKINPTSSERTQSGLAAPPPVPVPVAYRHRVEQARQRAGPGERPEQRQRSLWPDCRSRVTSGRNDDVAVHQSGGQAHADERSAV